MSVRHRWCSCAVHAPLALPIKSSSRRTSFISDDQKIFCLKSCNFVKNDVFFFFFFFQKRRCTTSVLICLEQLCKVMDWLLKHCERNYYTNLSSWISHNPENLYVWKLVISSGQKWSFLFQNDSCTFVLCLPQLCKVSDWLFETNLSSCYTNILKNPSLKKSVILSKMNFPFSKGQLRIFNQSTISEQSFKFMAKDCGKSWLYKHVILN